MSIDWTTFRFDRMRSTNLGSRRPLPRSSRIANNIAAVQSRFRDLPLFYSGESITAAWEGTPVDDFEFSLCS